MDVTGHPEEDTMDVDQPSEEVVVSVSNIGAHRQTRNRNISDRHHPYARTTPTPETHMSEPVLSISERELPPCKFLNLNI